MSPLTSMQNAHLYNLANAVVSALEAYQEADDRERKAGLISAADHLAREIRTIAWDRFEAGAHKAAAGDSEEP